MPSSSIRNGYSFVPCVGAAVLDDAQPARRDLVDHAVVEQDHAVGDVLLQAVAGERAVAALAGDDGGDALVLEPAEQAAQLGAQDGVRWTARRTASRWCRARRAWRRSSRSRSRGGRTALRGRTRRSPRSRCARRARSRRRACFCATSSSRSKPSERTFCVSSSAGLLERHEHARLAELRRAADQELHRQQRLAAAGAAADQRRPAARQARRR